jgi:very-short-patch-repair endonuclease
MTEPRRLLQRLLEYIEEQAKEIDPRQFSLSYAKGFIRRSTEVAGLPGVEYDIKVEGDHIWLRVARFTPTEAPVVPEQFRAFIRAVNDPDGTPPFLDDAAFRRWLNKTAEGKSPDRRGDLEKQGRATVGKALHEYATFWNAWANEERPRRKTIALYGDLFSLRHQLAAEETTRPQELVWGIGIATRKLEFERSEFDFEYPILTQAAEIALDEMTMSLEIRPRATDTRVELDAFVACSVPGATEVERAAREHLARNKDRPVSPFDPASYTEVLKLAASNLDSFGTYREFAADNEPVPAAGEHLVVTDAWVLLSRPRSNNYLFADLKRLQEKLQSGCEIPAGPLALVTPSSDQPVEYEPVRFRGLSSRGMPDSGKAQEELYFPLPYNDEQVTIVQYLERAPGVTVQGPPGTGKTHTIANIVCHYLAKGRRVLVTSRGERALEVLRDKIPEEVRPLTVALLASDREGVRQFQTAIEAIQHQVSQLNPEITKREIVTTTSAIDRAHSELIDLDRRVDEIAAAQLADINVDGVLMRAQKLAQLVVAGAAWHTWFDDEVSLAPEHAPPLSDDEAGRLRDARRRLGADLVYANSRIPSVEELPTPVEVGELHELLSKIKEIEDAVANGQVLPLAATTAEVLEAARALSDQITEAMRLVESLETAGSDWPSQLRIKCRQPSFASERAALKALFGDLDILIDARAAFLKRPVDFPEAGLYSVKTREAISRGAELGRPFAAIAIGAAEAKEHIKLIRVSGLPPAHANDWAHVRRFVELHEQVLSFVTRWNHCAAELSIPKLDGGISKLRHIEVTANLARTAHRLATQHDVLLPKNAESVFDQVPVAALTGNAGQLASILEQLKRHLTRADLTQALTYLAAMQEKLAGTSGPVSSQLRLFIDSQLGNPELSSERVAAHYAEICVELRRIGALSNEFAIVQDMRKRFAEAGAHKLATRIVSVAVRSSGEDRVFPATWREAWNWARMRRHLDNIESREELITLAERRREIEAGLAKRYVSVVAKASWLSTKRNASPRLLQALSGYATAIRRIGQGTGPNATRYRRDAREAMLDAAGAVPCWIMSHARISESIPAEIGAFDLVIVDEASQSDLWALPAILRGKKILVVGDHKQVSPDAGFIAAQRIQELKQRFLAEQPYRDEMTPEKSLYELAVRVYSAANIMLREHFRCVPPIIAYSNRAHYGGQIQPIRIPNATERIDPPLVDIHVPGGERDKRDRNDLEAQAIAAEVVALIADQRFAGRTIGVVSLLGSEQANYIDAVVRRQCDAAELIRRRFECGDARNFQGSDRDIIFLSMVVDPQNCRPLSGLMFEQRFNVAASRARDRMYLVRSVTASDLSDRDIRAGLLSHFDKPLAADTQESESLLERCESEFEREVYGELVSRGYRVIPQVKTGAYRIDLVVEGSGDTRLAVECDGDEFHGHDRWQHDTARQRVLERAGWTFWRCFASTWTLRKDEVFAELLERLGALGIEPIGAIDHAPSLVEKRTWKAPAEPETALAPQMQQAGDAGDELPRLDRLGQVHLVAGQE